MERIYSCIDEAQKGIIQAILDEGSSASPRNRPTREILNFNFTIVNPLNRILTLTNRRWSLPLAIGELCWHLSANDDAESISYYAKKWLESANDKGVIEQSSYGKRIFGIKDGRSQWSSLVETLKTDPFSRRAMVFLGKPAGHEDAFSTDISCTTSFQFFIRNNSLEMIVSMRSNDAIYGVPYDVFFFTFLQEMMAKTLNLELGNYHHNAASMHIYNDKFKVAKGILNSESDQFLSMMPLPSLHGLKDLIYSEKAIREMGCYPKVNRCDYWQFLIEVLWNYRKIKSNDNNYNLSTDNPYKKIFYNYAAYRNV
ncbi:thymidylate synthase [Alcanivorax jadensis]|uniref:thymidylate synthase n=1 Tax=Alcanivorax jadensis TaxID=64988 RepID=UPI00356271F7